MQWLKTLAENRFFEGLAREQLRAIRGAASATSFAPGEWIVRDGDAADVFYVLLDGEAVVQLCVSGRGAITVETVAAGGLIGWSWLFPPYRSHFDVRASTAVRALVFDGVRLRILCEEDPLLGFEMMKRFAPILIERLDALREQASR
jgi:CRP-like cAMP-binding protein